MTHLPEVEVLLKKCTVRVADGDVGLGTGFFIAPGFAITASHVVGSAPGRQVTLVASDGTKLAGHVVQVWPEPLVTHGPTGLHLPPDVALISLEHDGHPCVLLSRTAPQSQASVKVRGYSRRLELTPTAETTVLTYSGEIEQRGHTQPLYKFADGEVPPGMSGGAVLDLANSQVIGMMRTAREEDTDRGGWVVSSAQILELVGTVAQEHDDFHARDSRWRDATRTAPRQPKWWDDQPIRPFEYLAGKRGRNKYLLSENLTYVHYTGEHESFNPANLLTELRASDPGVLLVAPPGAGKTRLCWEVGKLALADNWRVWCTRSPSIHQAESATNRLTVEHLRLAVFGEEGEPRADRVLIVLDYLDNHDKSLDFDVLERLIEDADQEGVHVALLATCRPGAQHPLLVVASSLFAPRRLPQEKEHQNQVVDTILAQLAPNALKKWSRAELRRRCGAAHATPLFTLLLAVAWERVARSGADVPDTRLLDDWLHSRLAFDSLLSGRPAGRLLSDGDLLGYALAANTCPGRISQLTATVRRAMSAFDPAELKVTDHVLKLEETGWLVRPDTDDHEDPELDLLHDVVADALLRACLFPKGTAEIDAAAAQIMLDSACADAIAFERFCMHISRQYVDLADDQGHRLHAEKLRQVCERWLQNNEVVLGSALEKAGDAGELAKYALLHHEPWARLIGNHFDAVLGPSPGTSLIVESLRGVPGDRPVTQALIWLARNKNSAEAKHVLTPLLRRRELRDSGWARQTVAYAREWTRNYRDQADGDRLLRAVLMNRKLLASDQLDDFATHAESLLQSLHRDKRNDLLHALLVHGEQTGRRSVDLVADAQAAITTWPTHRSVGSLITHLLMATAVDVDRTELATQALSWLDVHSAAATTPQLLRVLLSARDLGADVQREVVDQTLTWLGRRLSEQNAASVLLSLLQRDDLTADQIQRVVQQAFRWMRLPQQLDASGLRAWPPQGHEVVAEAIRRSQVFAFAPASALGVFNVLPWHRSEKLAPQDAEVLCALLLSKHPRRMRRKLRSAAFVWLDRFSPTLDASWVLEGLLSVELSTAEWAKIAPIMDSWLRTHRSRPEASWVINAALRQDTSVPPEVVSAVEGHAKAWLAEAEDAPSARAVLKTLVSQRRIDEDAVSNVVARLLTRSGGTADDARFALFNELYPRSDMLALRSMSTSALLDRLEREAAMHRSSHTIAVLLRRQLDYHKLSMITAHAAVWLRHNSDRSNAVTVLGAVLRIGKDRRESTSSAPMVGPALEWVRARPEQPDTGAAFSSLLARHDLTEQQRGEMEALALTWLNANAKLPAAASVSISLMGEGSTLGHSLLRGVIDKAIAWIRSRPTSGATAILVLELWRTSQVSKAEKAELLEVAMEWLDFRSPCSFVGVQLLSRSLKSLSGAVVPRTLAHRNLAHALTCIKYFDQPPDFPNNDFNQSNSVPRIHRNVSTVAWAALRMSLVDPERSQSLIQHVLTWLDRDDMLQVMPHVLQNLLQHKHLNFDHARMVLDRAVDWIASGPEEASAVFVAQRLLEVRHLSREQLATVSAWSLKWLEVDLDNGATRYLLEPLLSRPDVPDNELKRGLVIATKWLEGERPPHHVSHVLQGMLYCTMLTGTAARDVIELAIGWADGQPAAEIGRVLQGLLARRDLTADEIDLIAARSIQVIKEYPSEEMVGYCLTALLQRLDDVPQHESEAVSLAWQWLTTSGAERPSFPHVSRYVLNGGGLSGPQRDRLTAMTFAWLVDWPFRGPASHALISLVHRGGHSDSDWTKILNYGMAWLSANERVFEMVPAASDGVAAELAEALLTLPALNDTSREEVSDVLTRLRKPDETRH